ncbi:MAG: hypothetical protein C0436_05615 [Alphaproteobacteria bacterium]|nr:hypothetical protein [Alphaproteobacteria bacterium]
MTAVAFDSDSLRTNPLDIAEQLILDREWLCDRPVEEELVAEVQSSWCNYRIWFTWQPDLGVLIFSCAYDIKIHEKHRAKLYPLLAAVNEKLWLGHFDLSSDDGIIMYRHAQLLRGAQGASPEQLEDLLDIAITECNRFFPAFQSVLWGGNTHEEALEIALLDTVGEA